MERKWERLRRLLSCILRPIYDNTLFFSDAVRHYASPGGSHLLSAKKGGGGGFRFWVLKSWWIDDQKLKKIQIFAMRKDWSERRKGGVEW